MDMFERWAEAVWHDGASLPPWRRRLRQAVRLLWLLASSEVRTPLLLRATSLAYTTLLSLVPLLAVSFSILKAFGVHEMVRPLLEDFLAPLGEQGHLLAGRIIEFVDNVHAGLLGVVGMAFLFWTAVSLINKIEDAFNAIWHVGEARSFALRLSGYLSVLLVGPVLVFSAFGLTASLLHSPWVTHLRELFGPVFLWVGMLTPYLLTTLAFWFVYLLLPNTRVAWRPAFWGALTGAVTWRLSGLAFARLVTGSGRYPTIYSSFVGLILFLLWLQLSWVIFLFGAQLAFYLQHPERIRRPGHPRPGLLAFEALALGVLHTVLSAFREGRPGPTEAELEEALNADPDLLDAVLERLRGAGLLLTDGEDRWLPARDLGKTTLEALWCTLRGDLAGADRDERGLRLPPAVERLVAALARGEPPPAQTVDEWLAGDDGDKVTPLPRRRDR